MSRPALTRIALPLLVLVLTAGCTVGADPAQEDAAPTAPADGGDQEERTPSSGQPDEPTEESSEPAPGTTVAASAAAVPSDLDVGAPSGWTVWQVDRLVLAVPPGMTPAAEGEGIPSSSVTFVPEPAEDGEVLGALAVFVETGAVGPLAIRTDVLRDVRDDQTGTEALEDPVEVDVPGAVGATALRYRYDVTGPVTGEVFDSYQVDVTVQVPDPGPQYGVFLSGATELVTEEDLQVFTQSLRVVDEAGA